MQKKLFAVVMVFSFYVLFILVFANANTQGYVGQFISDVGATDNAAMTTQPAQLGTSYDNMLLTTSLRRPMPKPKIPPYPPPDVTSLRRPMPKPKIPPYPPPDVTNSLRRPMPKPKIPPYPPPDAK